jgi:hypothetical protein
VRWKVDLRKAVITNVKPALTNCTMTPEHTKMYHMN